MKMFQGKSKTMPMQIVWGRGGGGGRVEAVYYGIVQVVDAYLELLCFTHLPPQEL